MGYILLARKLSTDNMFQSAVGRQSTFLTLVWVIGMGLVLLISIVYIEAYLRKGIVKGVLALSIARVYTPFLLLIFLVDLVEILVRGGSVSWIYWLMMFLELGIGIILLLYSGSPRLFKPTPPVDQAPSLPKK